MANLKKEHLTKEDGRYIIFYDFEPEEQDVEPESEQR